MDCFVAVAPRNDGLVGDRTSSHRALAVRSEVISPQLFTLNAANGTIREPLVCHAIIDDANRKPVTHIAENADAFDRFASGPTPDMLQAITREVCAADCHRMSQETHERFYRF